MHKGDPRGKRSHPKESPHRSASIHRPRGRRRAAAWWAGRSARRAASLVAETLSLARKVGAAGLILPTRVADELDDARNTGAQPHGTASDSEADLARNWHDGDKRRTEAA